MTVVVERPPDGDGLCPEAAVREADHEWCPRPQYPRDFTQYRDRSLQVLDRHANHRGVEAGIAERQARLTVEVLDEPTVEPRIGGELGGVHAVADHLLVRDFRRQVADPAAHQVEQHAIRRQQVAVEAGQRRYGTLVDVTDEPRRLIEDLVRLVVELGKGAVRQPELILHPWTAFSTTRFWRDNLIQPWTRSTQLLNPGRLPTRSKAPERHPFGHGRRLWLRSSKRRRVPARPSISSSGSPGALTTPIAFSEAGGLRLPDPPKR